MYIKALDCLDLSMKRQVQSLADEESETTQEKVLRPPADRAIMSEG
jgi:hypothetical protein